MILTRSTSLVTVSLLCLVAMPASSAMGKTKRKAPVRPTVSSVAPLNAGVGDLLTIKGKDFVLGKKKNTVFFKAGSRPAVSVKADTATRTTLKVVIPKTVEQYLTVTGGVVQPTRVRLKVLAKRFAKSYTALRLSPMITLGNQPGPSLVNPVTGVSGDCDGDGIINSVDTDDDNDLLSDALEAYLKLDPCKADTDGDGVADGYEYQSALDLNRTISYDGSAGPVPYPFPYPEKRPYPNPLDGTDAGTDFDGDGLTMAQEFLMWKTYGANSPVLDYSAGLKKSNADRPILASSVQEHVCLSNPSEACNDDYRDVDADALGNFDEFNGRMQPAWWIAHYPSETYPQSYAGTSAVDPDTDGDTVPDGADDIDHDDTNPTAVITNTNAQEIYGRYQDDSTLRTRTNPFNPCLPDPVNSPTCSDHPPLASPYAPYDTGWTIVPIPWPSGA